MHGKTDKVTANKPLDILDESQLDSTQITKLIESLQAYVLHAAYGKAMLQAHSLELSLTNLLITNLVDLKNDEDRFKSESARIKRLTMGKLIAEVIEKYEISDYWKEEFDNVLFFRNRLTHQISEDIISSHFKEDGRAKLISEIEEIVGYFKEAKGEIERIMFRWLSVKGFEKDQLLEVAKNWLEQSRRD